MSVIVSTLQAGNNNYPTPPQSFQPNVGEIFHDGVIQPDGFIVAAQASPNMTVQVAAGDALVTATPTSESQRQFRATHNQSDNVTISANASGSTKYDLVYILLPAAALHNPASSGDFTAASTLFTERHNNSGEALTVSNGYVLAEVTVANNASSITSGNITDRRSHVFDGWNGSQFAWTFNSQSNPYSGSAKTGTFTVAHDVTLQLTKGTKIRFRQQGSNTWIYGDVISASLSVTTLVTFVMDSATAYTNVAIYDAAYSNESSPVGHPTWLNYTPSYHGSGSMSVSFSSSQGSKFKVDGSTMTVLLDAILTVGGTPDFGVYATAPIAPVSANWSGSGYANNSAGYQTKWDSGGAPAAIQWRKYDGGNHSSTTTGYFGAISLQF
jgi:hypothetical protein